MAKSSVHFILKDGRDYKDLAPVFPDILKSVLILNLNMDDLEQNRKPEGYIRKARVRIVFPLDRKEFYVQSYSPKHVDLDKVKNSVSLLLSDASVKFDVTEDDDIKFDLK